MKVIGIIRIRNEAEIIQETLDHMSEFCTGGIYVFDDVSTDNTVKICKSHPSVKYVLENKVHQVCRDLANTENRQRIWLYAKQFIDLENDWVIYMDADERVEFPWESLALSKFDGYRFRLFDYYITPEDINLRYTERKWLGPEYRDILFLMRASAIRGWVASAAREATLKQNSRITREGFVKHYGKAISVQQWEDTCDYYANSKFSVQSGFNAKWKARKGKAIHASHSDFGRPLITWDEKESKGVLMGTKLKVIK